MNSTDSSHKRTSGFRLLGPAFVAAVAYVDPGNVAANLSAGARYGYLLVWVLVLANLMSVLVQYLSAKLGLATGQSLPDVLGGRLRKPARIAFFLQAELIAIATDLAEVVGGAIALYLLFSLPLVVGGLIVGGVSMLLLHLQSGRATGERRFEVVITGLLLIITLGFIAGLFFSDISGTELVSGLIPRFADSNSILLAASMLGATVMPHAIYLHSSLTREHAHTTGADSPDSSVVHHRRLIRASRWDVLCALFIAGSVNIGMLVLAAANLRGHDGTETIQGAHAAIAETLGPGIALIFAVGLLASGLASTSVGSYAGAEVLSGLLKVRPPLLVQRLITLVPALVILAVGVQPTFALVASQVVLSFGIPFALIPLVVYTGRRSLMGQDVNNRVTQGLAWLATALIVALNVGLIVLTFTQ
ncbi:MAG: Nramp family divalent metal transporter [Propionibacteriaceae bacterium]|jgi:manganese transport protein|nr:Nramp family divalent metal transporter [Propionibacteriaceae bacterium]